jgi:FkbM family methyltransferase
VSENYDPNPMRSLPGRSLISAAVTSQALDAVTRCVDLGDGIVHELCLEPGSDDPVVQAYLRGEQPNSYLVDLVRQLMPYPGTLVEVGCHVGTLCLAAAALGHRVVAVDASLEHVRVVERSRRQNGFDQFVVLHAAVSDRSGVVAFRDEGLFGAVVEGARHTNLVRARTVPELLAEAHLDLADVDVLKLDIEGSELRAWAGMADDLSRTRGPMIVYESNPLTSANFGFSVETMRTALEASGYHTYRLYADGLYLCPPSQMQPEA